MDTKQMKPDILIVEPPHVLKMNFTDYVLALEKSNRELRAALAEQIGWRPIETAPKDGSEVLLMVKMRAGIPHGRLVGHYMRGGHCIDDHPPIDAGWFFWNGCMFDKAAEPTHWMPLPETGR